MHYMRALDVLRVETPELAALHFRNDAMMGRALSLGHAAASPPIGPWLSICYCTGSVDESGGQLRFSPDVFNWATASGAA